MALNLVFIYAAPLEDLKGETAVGALAASRLFGPQVAGIFAALMALSLMSTVNAMVTIGPRVYYAMAKNGAFPSIAAKVHPHWHTPVAAIVAQGVCTMLMTLTPFPQLVHLHRLHAEFFRGDERGVADDFPAAAGLAEAARGELRVSAVPGAFHPGGRVDDVSGDHAEALRRAGDRHHDRRRARWCITAAALANAGEPDGGNVLNGVRQDGSESYNEDAMALSSNG